MGMPWLQTKQYRCPKCHAIYLHDDAHHHAVFTCSQRPLTRTQLLEQFLMTGRTYRPTPEGSRWP